MMEPLDLILVGCGLMGARHLRGYAELARALPGSLRLRAVCDPRREVAEGLATEAEELLGRRPAVYASAEAALQVEKGIAAADVVTDNRSHDSVVLPLLEAGLHVQVEKPLAVTIPRAQAMIAAAHRARRLLVVGENNRRDPMNRLLQHVVRSGLIGEPYFLQQTSVGGNDAVIGTPWRHAWAMGGLALDVGIHFAYLMESVLGPIATVYGRCRQVLSQRRWAPPDGEPQWVEVESPDVFSAALTFETGAAGEWVMHFAGAGEAQWRRTIHGTEGTVDGPGDRSGQAVKVVRGGETLAGEALVAALPDYRLNEAETRLFGDRPAAYSLEGPVTDRKLLAAETANFLAAVRGEEQAESPAEAGIRAVAIIHALLESCLIGEAVSVADVLAGRAKSVEEKIECGPVPQ